MMKFYNKMDKHTFILMFSAFLWIFVCNVLVQVFHAPLAAAGIPGWTIFLANVLFFIKGNPKHPEGLLENACGGIFGLIGAIGLIYLNIWFKNMGWSSLAATLIAICIFLFLTIAVHPMLPYIFNNMALCFFLAALINEETQVNLISHPFSHFAGVILGNLIVNVGTVLIVNFVTKKLTKQS